MRIEFHPEHFEEQARSLRVFRQRIEHGSAAGDRTDLKSVSGVRSQDGDLWPGEAGRQHERVETVVIRQTQVYGEQRFAQEHADPGVFQRPRIGTLDDEAVNRGRAVPGSPHIHHVGLDHPEAEVLEDRHHVREYHGASLDEQPQLAGIEPVACLRLQRHLHVAGGLEPLETIDVFNRGVDIDRRHVFWGERVEISLRKPMGILYDVTLAEGASQALLPRSDDGGDLVLQRLDIQVDHTLRGGGDVKVQARAVSLAERQVVVEDAASELPREHASQTAPHLIGIVPLGQQNHHVDAALENVGGDDQADVTRVLRRHNGGDLFSQIFDADEEQLFLRNTVEEGNDRLVIV